jgi:lysozyme
MPPLNAVIYLSHYNRDPDLAAAKQDGIVGLIHKATQGADETDPTYAQSRAQARAAGLMWGAYHFATGDDPQAQASHFLSVAAADPGTLLALDFEHNPVGSSMSLDQARVFVTAVAQATGRYPGLYGGSYLRELLGGSADPVLAQCWFWLAEYGPEPHVPAGWPTWTLWQYTDGAYGPQPYEVAGVGRCDRDMFNCDEAQLQALWGARVS